MVKFSNNETPSLLLEEQGSDPSTPAAGFWRLYTKSGGLYVIDDAAAVTGPFGSSSATGQGLVDFDFVKRTAGDITCNSTSWATTGITTIVLTASAGDIVEVHANCLWGTEAVTGCLDFATIVSGSPVNYLGASGGGSDLGIQGLVGVASVTTPAAGTVMYVLQSGDISTGTVTLRVQYRTTSAANKTLRASSTQPFHWSAKNLGPAL